MALNTCFVIELRDGEGVTEAYDRRHAEIWPELTDAIRAAGIREYHLFRRDRTVYAFARCEPDGQTAFRALAAREIDAAWTAAMADLIAEETDASGELRYAEPVWSLPDGEERPGTCA
jgi:L-rhamnose mutarotase